MVTWNTKINKPLCFILFGYSLEELDNRIQEFKDLDVAWVSINWQQIASNILKKIDKQLDYHVWFKGAQVIGVGSFNRILFTTEPVNSKEERDRKEDQSLKELFYNRALEKGIFFGVNGLMFCSTAHTPIVIAKVIQCINSLL